jgi:hypothetical protein
MTAPGGRDRDPGGRPRNSRPRDGLGRPLPKDAVGEARVPDDLSLPPEESLALAQRMLDEGRPFHAHEVLEASWKAAPPAERDLWQGLAQLAVGLTHARRGNAAGAAALLRRGADRVGRYRTSEPARPGQPARADQPASPDDPVGADRHGVDADGVVAAATALADQIEAAGLSGLAPDQLSLRLR